MILRDERIGNQRLILGDCLAVMPGLGRFDAVVTDPPYGIDYGNSGGFSKSSRWKQWRGQAEWDKSRPDADAFAAILAASESQIIWGANYFSDLLPPKMGWLVWDKMQRDFSLADFELAWTSRDAAGRALSYSRPQALLDGRHHPTQKPVALMEWCLGFLPDAKTILDPYAGSGTVAVACQRMGRFSTSIELDPDYFDIACRRVDEAARQPDLLIEATRPQPVQQGLDL